MNRGVNHQRIFFADADRVEFGARLDEIHERFDATTLAYCLVENHYHLLLRTPDAMLSEAMHHLGLVFARRTNDRVGRDGPLFRGRFRSIPVTTDAYLLCAIRYIHRNALDVPGVDRIDRYRWSSLRAYLGLRPTPRFLDTTTVLEYFDRDVAAFARFSNDDAGVLVRSADDVVQLVRWAVLRHDLRRADGDPAPEWQERTALILLAEALSAIAADVARELGELMQFPSAAARRMARRRARERASHPAIAPVVADVLREISHRHAAA